jgi:hypothetical protein
MRAAQSGEAAAGLRGLSSACAHRTRQRVCVSDYDQLA